MGQGVSLKSEINNPWFIPCFNIVLHWRSMFRVHGMYNFGCPINWIYLTGTNQERGVIAFFIPLIWREFLRYYTVPCICHNIGDTFWKSKKKHENWVLNSRKLGTIFLVLCFIHPIFSSFCFWYFGHFSCVIFFLFFSVLPILPCKM